MVFGERFLLAKFGVRAAGCVTFFRSVGGEVTAVLQESCAQPEITILHLDGDLSSQRITQRYCFVYSPPLFLAALRGMWDPSFPTRDRTHAPCSGSPCFVYSLRRKQDPTPRLH